MLSAIIYYEFSYSTMLLV